MTSKKQQSKKQQLKEAMKELLESNKILHEEMKKSKIFDNPKKHKK